MSSAKTETVFGRKDKFAIEIKVNDVIEKSNLRLWIMNNPIGHFKRMDVLTDSVRNFKKLIFYKDTLYLKEVDQMNPKETFEWMLQQIQQGIENRMKYVRWMGEQLDEFSMIVFFRDNRFNWVVYDVKRKKATSYAIEESDLVGASTEYIDWYEKEYGVVICDYSMFP
jgi:hypothetical protein